MTRPCATSKYDAGNGYCCDEYNDDGRPKTHRIAANGYSPFEGKRGGAGLLDEPKLVAIARAHNRSASQVVLNWQWRRHRVAVNPTATSEKYQRLNLEFDGFELTEAEARELDEWPQTAPPTAPPQRTLPVANWCAKFRNWRYYPNMCDERCGLTV